MEGRLNQRCFLSLSNMLIIVFWANLLVVVSAQLSPDLKRLKLGMPHLPKPVTMRPATVAPDPCSWCEPKYTLSSKDMDSVSCRKLPRDICCRFRKRCCPPPTDPCDWCHKEVRYLDIKTLVWPQKVCCAKKRKCCPKLGPCDWCKNGTNSVGLWSKIWPRSWCCTKKNECCRDSDPCAWCHTGLQVRQPTSIAWPRKMCCSLHRKCCPKYGPCDWCHIGLKRIEPWAVIWPRYMCCSVQQKCCPKYHPCDWCEKDLKSIAPWQKIWPAKVCCALQQKCCPKYDPCDWCDGRKVIYPAWNVFWPREVCCHRKRRCCKNETDFCKCMQWTPWINGDKNPNDGGDFETLGFVDNVDNGHAGRVSKKLPFPCNNPIKIECRQSQTKKPWHESGDKTKFPKSVQCRTDRGLICFNNEQADGKCQDYEIRLLCWRPCKPTLNWTLWRDGDDPSGRCDCEFHAMADHPVRHYEPCPSGGSPIEVECKNLTGTSVFLTGQRKMQCNVQRGFYCFNVDQTGKCNDYKVRYLCHNP